MSVMTAPLMVAVHTVGLDERTALVADVRAGLLSTPRTMSPRWFYDERGSLLFEAITRLPEYYQTRTEATILEACAAEVAGRIVPEAVVEIGAGSCIKTRILLDAAAAAGALRTFVPVDVSEEMLQESARRLLGELPGLSVYAVVGDFSEHLRLVPRLGRQLVVFLGSTIGNLDTEPRARFLADVRSLLRPGDAFLLGIDLVKDRGELVRAYDDQAGVTAAFNRNMLSVLNSRLDADFDVGAFAHVARYDEPEHRIEMHLLARRDQHVEIRGAALAVDFAAGETLRTEISVKFTRELVTAELAAAGLRLERWFSDPRERFALVLATPGVA